METLPKTEIGIPINLENLGIYLSLYFYDCTDPIIFRVSNLIVNIIRLNAFYPVNYFYFLKLDELTKLGCAIAVYMIFDSLHRLVYIGSSTDIDKRLSRHEKIKPSDSWALVIPLDHIQGSKNWRTNLNLIEKALICAIRPERNELGYIRGKNKR